MAETIPDPPHDVGINTPYPERAEDVLASNQFVEIERAGAAIDSGLIDIAHQIGAYTGWMVRQLGAKGVKPELDVDYVHTKASKVGGWIESSRESMGQAWILHEDPAVWVPEHTDANSLHVDRSNNEVAHPAHLAPANGWCLLKDTARLASYIIGDHKNKAEVWEGAAVVDYTVAQPMIIEIGWDYNGLMTNEEAAMLLRFTNIDPAKAAKMVENETPPLTFKRLKTLRILRDWDTFLRKCVEMRQLGETT